MPLFLCLVTAFADERVAVNTLRLGGVGFVSANVYYAQVAAIFIGNVVTALGYGASDSGIS